MDDKKLIKWLDDLNHRVWALEKRHRTEDHDERHRLVDILNRLTSPCELCRWEMNANTDVGPCVACDYDGSHMHRPPSHFELSEGRHVDD